MPLAENYSPHDEFITQKPDVANFQTLFALFGIEMVIGAHVLVNPQSN
jgi:hypothetical protein